MLRTDCLLFTLKAAHFSRLLPHCTRMMAAMHGIHSHGQFFLHTKGGEECNRRHVSQKKSKEMAIALRHKGRFSRKAHTGKVAIGTRLVHLCHDPPPLCLRGCEG